MSQHALRLPHYTYLYTAVKYLPSSWLDWLCHVPLNSLSGGWSPHLPTAPFQNRKNMKEV